MSPEIAVLISFILFSIAFYLKVYPLLQKMIGNYISDVQDKIEEAERLKDEASALLKEAYINKDNVEEIIAANKRLADARIEEIKRQNEAHLEVIKARYEASLKTQLDAELSRQKNILIHKLSDLLTEKLSEKIKNDNIEVGLNVSKDDLLKLIKKTPL